MTLFGGGREWELWENFASTFNDSNKIDKANIEKAADKIHSCAKDTLDMLQNKVEEPAQTQSS